MQEAGEVLGQSKERRQIVAIAGQHQGEQQGGQKRLGSECRMIVGRCICSAYELLRAACVLHPEEA